MHEPTNQGPQPTAFKRFLTRASVIVKQPRRLQSLLAQVSKKIARISNKRIAGFKADVELLACLVKDFIAGRYRDISPQALITIVGGLLYFVVPLDAMPDFLFGWGLLDDGAVIAYVVSVVKDELTAYQIWREAQKSESVSEQQVVSVPSSESLENEDTEDPLK